MAPCNAILLPLHGTFFSVGEVMWQGKSPTLLRQRDVPNPLRQDKVKGLAIKNTLEALWIFVNGALILGGYLTAATRSCSSGQEALSTKKL